MVASGKMKKIIKKTPPKSPNTQLDYKDKEHTDREIRCICVGSNIILTNVIEETAAVELIIAEDCSN